MDQESVFYSIEECKPNRGSTDSEYQHIIEDSIVAKREVKILQTNLQMDRQDLSKSFQEMFDYINKNKKSDPLVSGFKSSKENPYHEKKCEIQ